MPRSDVQVLAEVAAAVQVPRHDAADSMVLHAPLELAARAALLPRVRPEARDEARDRVRDLGRAYTAFGAAVEPPPPVVAASPTDAASRLAAAIAAGDLDDVDRWAAALSACATAAEVRVLLADAIVPRLSAAAHGSIFLFVLPRIAPRGELPVALLRPLARELAREPDWALTWFADVAPASVAEGGDLFRAFAATPSLGVPGSDFIYPVMDQAERSGIASELLAGPTAAVSVADGARAILRAAAWSMLHEPDEHRPYGWSHCLTMPQGVLGVAGACADPRSALAVAATYVVGFRAAMATRPLDAGFEADAPDGTLGELLAAGPEAAAAAMWHTPEPGIEDAVTDLVTWVATQADAHLVKYTLACLDAAAWDRTHARLYRAAAACLAGFWARRP